MIEPQIAMNVRGADSGSRIIDVRGEVIATAGKVLTKAFTETPNGDNRAVIFNFEELEYMNSGDIGLLMRTLIRVNRDGQNLGTYGLNDHHPQIFSLTHPDKAISIFADAPTASAEDWPGWWGLAGPEYPNHFRKGHQ